jgi:glycolate oxidase
MKQQQRLKCAFDADHLLNPGKVFPAFASLCRIGAASCP